MIQPEQKRAFYWAILTQSLNILVEDLLNVTEAEMLLAGERGIQAQSFGMWFSISAGSSAIHQSISINTFSASASAIHQYQQFITASASTVSQHQHQHQKFISISNSSQRQLQHFLSISISACYHNADKLQQFISISAICETHIVNELKGCSQQPKLENFREIFKEGEGRSLHSQPIVFFV